MDRAKFLHWLSMSVFKTPLGTIPCRFVRIVKNILFPLHYYYQKQSNIRWDVYTNRYYFAGMEFTERDLLEFRYWLAKERAIGVRLIPEDRRMEGETIYDFKKRAEIENIGYVIYKKSNP